MICPLLCLDTCVIFICNCLGSVIRGCVFGLIFSIRIFCIGGAFISIFSIIVRTAFIKGVWLIDVRVIVFEECVDGDFVI